MQADEYVVFDTETTGLRSDDRIIEICFLRFVAGKIVESYETRINPERPIPMAASSIHGIFDEHVRDAPRFAEVLPEIWTWLDSDIPLVAHNLEFDLRMLSQSLPFEEWPRPTRLGVCTLRTAKNFHPELSTRNKGHTLSAVARYFGVRFDEASAHGARYDAEITGEIAPHLFPFANPLMLGEYSASLVRSRRQEEIAFPRR